MPVMGVHFQAKSAKKSTPKQVKKEDKSGSAKKKVKKETQEVQPAAEVFTRILSIT